MFTRKSHTLLGDSKLSSHKFKLNTNTYSKKGSSYSAFSHLTNTTSTRASSHDSPNAFSSSRSNHFQIHSQRDREKEMET
jgi:hypothetical protein